MIEILLTHKGRRPSVLGSHLEVPEAAEHEHEFVVEYAGLLLSIPLYQVPTVEL
jgi:hypothetical protein